MDRAHSILGLSCNEVQRHPKCGASFEGYVLENIINSIQNDLSEFYFWSTDSATELDLSVISGGLRFGYEFKYSDTPKMTKSMYMAMQELNLSEFTIVTTGSRSYILDKKVKVLGLMA